jgi:DNA-binding NarL/FixJ family response regulator
MNTLQINMKPAAAKAKTVVIIEDQTAIRELVSEMLQAKGKFKVVGACADGAAGVELALRLKPDILILDILLPDISGVEVLHRLRHEIPGLQVLVFSGKSERQLARGLIKEGVRGFVNKNSSLSELRKAMEALLEGKTWFSEEFNQALLVALKGPESNVDQMAVALTDREREVAVLLAKSHSSKEVAACLKISTKTAENHRTNLMRKLGVHDVAGVIRFVIRQGLYDPSAEA